ncbi:unnamed protein product [Rodentolepis nana]|uniref:Rotamase n=1 Tax=Rodentolepis nana TaxID=102285 RepID=A0A0R3TS38_RODNA|nr:unnamed protein product [Rodentolepis nana]
MEKSETVNAFESVTDDNGILKKVIQKGWIPVKPSENNQFTVEILRTYEDGPKKGEVVESDTEKDPIRTIHFRGIERNYLKYALVSMELGEISEFILQPKYSGGSEAHRCRIKLIDFGAFYEYSHQVQRVFSIAHDCGSLYPGQKVDIHAKGYCNGQLYHEHRASVFAADADYTELPRTVVAQLRRLGPKGGWLKLVNINEISDKEREKFGFPSNGAVWYHVEVESSISGGTVSVEMADDFLRAGKCRLAEEIYDHCTSSYTDRCPKEAIPRAHLNAALASLQIGSPDKCLRHCQRYSQNGAEDDKYYFRLGQAFFMKHDFRRAEEHFRAASIRSSESNREEILQAANLSGRRYKSKYDNILRTMMEHAPVLLAQQI